MNESKVEVIFGHDCNVSTAYTTHADYRALEEINRQLVDKSNRLTILTARLEEELASIKVRVGDLVAADHEYDICSLEFREAYNEGCDETEALADDLTRAASRRRLALESFT